MQALAFLDRSRRKKLEEKVGRIPEYNPTPQIEFFDPNRATTKEHTDFSEFQVPPPWFARITRTNAGPWLWNSFGDPGKQLQKITEFEKHKQKSEPTHSANENHSKTWSIWPKIPLAAKETHVPRLMINLPGKENIIQPQPIISYHIPSPPKNGFWILPMMAQKNQARENLICLRGEITPPSLYGPPL